MLITYSVSQQIRIIFKTFAFTFSSYAVVYSSLRLPAIKLVRTQIDPLSAALSIASNPITY